MGVTGKKTAGYEQGNYEIPRIPVQTKSNPIALMQAKLALHLVVSLTLNKEKLDAD